MTQAVAPQCYAIVLGAVHDSEPCECCGEITRTANGFVSKHGTTIAAYFVRWILGCSNSARWEFIIGGWGDGASADNRCVVCAEYFVDHSPGLMVVDADDAWATASLATHRLKRRDVIGDPLATEVFAIYDTIVLDDGRLAELHPWRIVN